MIEKKEIDAKGKEFEIHPSNVQRDYIFGWLLFGIFTQSGLKDKIFLKGGNALRKGYLENTRFSNDLDFGIPGDIAQEILLYEINKVCEFIQEKTGVTFVNEQTRVEEKFTATESPLPDLKVYEVRVYFKDFEGNAEHIKIKISMDITRFDKAMLELQMVKLIHPYSDASELVCEIRCMKLEEIIATKLKCLMQRQHAPDLFDYAYSIKLLGGSLNKEEVVKTLIKKTIFDRNPYILKDILLKTVFSYFREAWEKSIICAKKFILGAEDAISFLIEDLEYLFSGYTNNGYAQFVYFDPETRAKIMHAGRTQTLLKIRYKGHDRIVEPYSLKYLKAKNGEFHEYFYAHNCSGGRSAPGIRSFLPKPLESVENTEEKFIPRFQIELSKAGEIPENPYLFDPNKPVKVSRTRLVRSITSHTKPHFSGVLKYKFKCSVCGKQFTRSNNNSSLRPHKNKDGYKCNGTYGVYVGVSY